MTRLRGDKVALRELTSRDLETLRGFVNDPEVMRSSSVYAPVSDVQQDAWWRTATTNSHATWFAIEDVRAEPRLVGTCCLVDIDWIGRAAELRVRIGAKDVWGAGLGTEACELLLRFGFADLNLERIGLRVWGSNARAQRVYQKLGFVVEGRLRRAAFVHGNHEDIVLMGLLRDEWKARPA
jgi:RimJ/RimL family protein N-acetyltransferase